MLSPQLTRAKKRKDELVLRPLTPKERAQASSLARELLTTAEACVGATRAELADALAAVPVAAKERKMMAALAHLVEDGCEISAETVVPAPELRRDVFERAAAARRAAGRIERDAILREVAAARALDVADVERGLHADLKQEHIVLRAPRESASALVDRYELAERQAILLRAVRVTAEVECASAQAYRALFAKLKFRRLLHRIQRLDDGRYRIEIDGPFSLFESVTKYGLALALMLPALEACRGLTLEAELSWGPRRERLTYRATHIGSSEALTDVAPSEEAQGLIAAFERLGGPWRARPCREILDLPGHGLCVPDLVFTHARDGREVLLEILGFWSRDAVWRRVELVQSGLGRRVVFAVSQRLRVSAEVLEDAETAALYVYKTTIAPRSLARCLDRVATAGSPGRGMNSRGGRSSNRVKEEA